MVAYDIACVHFTGSYACLRRQTVPEINRLETMTVQRCRPSAHAGPEREPADWSMPLSPGCIGEIGNAVAPRAAGSVTRTRFGGHESRCQTSI
jgi:hypothetical protein